MLDKFETLEMAKTFQKFKDDLLGSIQFDFQINKKTTGNRIIKIFLMNSNKFTQMKINSPMNFLEADSIVTQNVDRIEKLSVTLFESLSKLNSVIAKF